MNSKCISCKGSFFPEPLLELTNMPAAVQHLPDRDSCENTGMDMRLCRCSKCGLIQFDCDPVFYYKDVIRAGGFTSTMTDLRKSQYERLINRYGLEGKKFAEFGCGQGEFISVLKDFPVEAYGIEHDRSLVDIAVSKGLRVQQGFTESADTVFENAPFDVFLSFNFIEHQPDPNMYLKAIFNNLTDDGMGLITAPSWEYISENGSYYELMRDHIAYYSFETLGRLLESNGFSVLEKEMINADTLSLTVKKRQPVSAGKLKESLKKLSEEISVHIREAGMQNKKIATWAASHQGLTLISTTALSGHIEYIIDSAPFKQGRYSPGSSAKIVSPEYFFKHPVDEIIITAPGYTREIAETIAAKYGSAVEIYAIVTDRLEKIN